ncbi:MAG: hypothetical protein ACRD4K_03520 [Candidatus Acidiferrales bacterium]
MQEFTSFKSESIIPLKPMRIFFPTRNRADGADLISQQSDAGLDKITKSPWGNRLVHNPYTWMSALEHSGEHYGQLVAYYGANHMVPADSRR